MGRHIPVVMTEADEARFLAFLSRHAEIGIILDFADTTDELMLEQFTPRSERSQSFWIWNGGFPWPLRFECVTHDRSGAQQGKYYVADPQHGPLIHYSRHNISQSYRFPGSVDRGSGSTGSAEYDVRAFTAWYDKIARWIRRHGNRVDGTYFLPDADHHRLK